MKKRLYWQSTFFVFALAITLLFAFSLISFSNASNLKEGLKTEHTKQSIPYINKGIYVIVGAFRIPENAIKYARSIKIEGESPRVGRYRANKLYYVYAYAVGENLGFARQKRSELRRTSRFYDAWILYVDINLNALKKKETTPDLVVINQAKEIEVEETIVPVPKPVPVEEEIIPPPPSTVQQGQLSFKYRFNVVNATSLKEVPGYITIIDAARSKSMRSVSTNQVHALNAPNSQSKEIIALCDIFGFAKTQAKLKIDAPMTSEDNSLFSQSEDITTIKFDLIRHKVGDMLTMYNVYFYNNSAIMKPESKFELNSLLSMLKENDKLEIKIHGHTNGNASGKIIKLKKGDTNFFEVSDNNDENNGSAKKLSESRAEIIQNWLINNGIDAGRMTLKGWGGKKMLYKKTDKLAGRNVRVEIEILKE